MAFVDALELASEAGTADALSTMAKPVLSELAPATVSQADPAAVRGIGTSISPSKVDPGVPAQVGALPAVILPFGDPALNIAAFIGITVLGVVVSDLGYNAVTVTIVLGMALVALYIIGKRIVKSVTTAAK